MSGRLLVFCALTVVCCHSSAKSRHLFEPEPSDHVTPHRKLTAVAAGAGPAAAGDTPQSPTDFKVWPYFETWDDLTYVEKLTAIMDSVKFCESAEFPNSIYHKLFPIMQPTMAGVTQLHHLERAEKRGLYHVINVYNKILAQQRRDIGVHFCDEKYGEMLEDIIQNDDSYKLIYDTCEGFKLKTSYVEMLQELVREGPSFRTCYFHLEDFLRKQTIPIVSDYGALIMSQTEQTKPFAYPPKQRISVLPPFAREISHSQGLGSNKEELMLPLSFPESMQTFTAKSNGAMLRYQEFVDRLWILPHFSSFRLYTRTAGDVSGDMIFNKPFRSKGVHKSKVVYMEFDGRPILPEIIEFQNEYLYALQRDDMALVLRFQVPKEKELKVSEVRVSKGFDLQWKKAEDCTREPTSAHVTVWKEEKLSKLVDVVFYCL